MQVADGQNKLTNYAERHARRQTDACLFVVKPIHVMLKSDQAETQAFKTQWVIDLVLV